MNDLATLQLFNLISPSLPIGAFAYSQGLEYAIDQEWLSSKVCVQQWISDILINNIAQWDLPCLRLMLESLLENDYECFSNINQMLLASRESKELWLEDTQIGKALCKLLFNLELAPNILQKQIHCSYAASFSAACFTHKVSEDSMLLGFCWAWCENQLVAAAKLLPMGQTDIQKTLQSLMPIIQASIKKSKQLSIDNLGCSMPRLAISSSLHEHQYSRLFRS